MSEDRIYQKLDSIDGRLDEQAQRLTVIESKFHTTPCNALTQFMAAITKKVDDFIAEVRGREQASRNKSSARIWAITQYIIQFASAFGVLYLAYLAGIKP